MKNGENGERLPVIQSGDKHFAVASKGLLFRLMVVKSYSRSIKCFCNSNWRGNITPK